MLNLQIQHLKTEIAGIEEENAAKRAKLMEDSARARDEDWRGKEEEVELNFDDSSVKRYNCEVGRVSGWLHLRPSLRFLCSCVFCESCRSCLHTSLICSSIDVTQD